MKNSELDPHIQQHLFDLLFLIQIKMKDVIQDTDHALSPVQIVILRALAEEGEMSQAMLVQKIKRDKSQVTRLIHDLEEKKLLVKKRNETDRRSFILKPIREVQEKISFFIEKEREMVTDMLSGISKADVRKLEEMLILMSENLRK